jgi:carbamoyltransferase
VTEPVILGISSAVHNGAACVIRGSELLVAIQEERLTRVKRDALHPEREPLCIDYCLRTAGLQWKDVDIVVDCSITMPDEDPDRRATVWPAFGGIPERTEVLSIPHHLGHAYSTFATSGFSDALVLVIDGGGSRGRQLDASERAACVDFDDDWFEHLSIYKAAGRTLEPVEKLLGHMPYLHEMPPHGMPPFASLGHMFSSVSTQLFGDYHAAGKVMALATAEPQIPIDEFLTLAEARLTFPATVIERFPHDRRWPELADEYIQLASSAQSALERALCFVRDRLRAIAGGQTNLCYAGGVALNGVANRRVFLDGTFAGTHIMPAADDAGAAIGAAYFGLAQSAASFTRRRLRRDSHGASYGRSALDAAVAALPSVETVAEGSEALRVAGELVAQGAIVGWFQGGAEFGPRALGARNLLCDPRLHDGQELMNRVKRRESFRPFAPAVLRERVVEWFDVDKASHAMDFMLDICDVRMEKASLIPAVVHVDGTARVHSVDRDFNPRFHEVITAFERHSGVPMLVSTSMNLSDEPIIETPWEALWLTLTTAVGACVIDDVLVVPGHGFTSILDFVPVWDAELISLDAHGAHFLAETPHGRVTRVLRPAEAIWRDRFDGTRTAESLRTEYGISRKDFTVLLSRYARQSLAYVRQ